MHGPALVLSALLAPLAGFIVVMLVVSLLSRFSGWAELARSYPGHPEDPPGDRLLGSGAFRGWLGYNNAIIFAPGRTGLSMRGLPFIMANHAPIFIPWPELTVVQIRRWYGDGLLLKTARAPQVEFAVRGRVVRPISEAMAAAGVTIQSQNS